MSPETDQPRQRTVAELLAENGGTAASGRRRRRREVDDGEPVGAPPAAEGPGVPGRHGGTQTWRPEPAPAVAPEPWRTAEAPDPASPWERGGRGGPRLERETEEEPGDERGTGFGPGPAAPSNAALGFGPPAPGRRGADDARPDGDRSGGPTGAAPTGFGPWAGAEATQVRPGQNGAGRSGAVPNGFGPNGAPQNGGGHNGFAPNGGPNGGPNGFAPNGAAPSSGASGRNGFGSGAGRNGVGPNAPGRNGTAPAPNGPAPFGRPQPGRPEAPGADAWAGPSTTGAPRPPGGQPPNGRPARPGEPGTEQLGRVRTPQDDPLTAPFGSVHAGGPPTRFGAPPARADEDDAGPPTQFGAPPIDDDEDEAGPPTQLGAPLLHDEDDLDERLDERHDDRYDDHDDGYDGGYGDDTYRAPAGLGRRAPERVEEEPEEDEGTPQGWAVVIGQWIAGALVGAAVWVGFRYLWFNLPVVALAAAVIITVGLVLGVRALLRNDDLRTTAFAVGVGLLLTVSPAILVLLER
ncbi:hypothetical protein ACFQH9_29980 [Pseudonocardia lutea]|uniref:Uncharacterized protein n=1 Tax=Pseudonocardia lutea TaxID=2172015 RepID=A0ABW1IH80_9PSEU